MDSKGKPFIFALSLYSYLLLSCCVLAGSISLSTDIELPAPAPDPNEDITVWINTDAPLFYMNMEIRVIGDATITAAMTETDCNDFGWSIDYTPISTVNSDNSIEFHGLNWSNNSNETIGYFKFRCNSGQVSVYIDAENSFPFSFSESFTCSTEAIVVGTLTLPPVVEPNEPEPVFLQSPDNASGQQRIELDSLAQWPQQVTMFQMLDSEPTVYVIDSDITENQVWDANDIYYIVGDPNNSYIVDVNSLLVIEPGTTVIMGHQSGLHVSNGGTLIAKGTPDKPIIFTPDWVFFDYPDYVGYYWQVYNSYGSYYHSIYIEDTASPLTIVKYCMIEGAFKGIITDNVRLDNAIENNYLFGNMWGIYEFGPLLTDVCNNLCFYQDQAAIEIELCPDPNNGFADLDHAAKIEHNTCDGSDYTYCGITVHGVADPNTSGVPTIYLTNNIVTSNYNYGMNLVGGAMYAMVVSTGYFGNYYDKNWEFDEYNPVTTETNPYYPYILDRPYKHHYLIGDAAFVDAGLQYIERGNLIGTKTNADNIPDKDVIDLGFHHSMWEYVGGEGIAGTDIDDLIEISDYWLEYSPFEPNSPGYIDPNLYIYDPNNPEQWIDPNTVTYGGDWNDDGAVDLRDFSIIAGMWQAAPETPVLVPVISTGISDGWIRLGVSGFTANTQAVFALINGEYVGKISGFSTGKTLDVDLSGFGPQRCQVKLIGLSWDGYLTSSAPIDFTPPLGIDYCTLPQSYEPNEPLAFAAYNAEPNDITVEVYADGGQLVWSQQFSGNTVCGSIPATITGNHEIECVYFDKGSGASVVAKPTYKKIPRKINPNVKALIMLPNRLINLYDFRTIGAVEDALKDKGITYIKYMGPHATSVNLARYAPQLKYLYINGHGHWSFEGNGSGVLRTNIDLADGTCVSAKASDFVGTPPIWCQDPLPGNLEQSTPSFASMGFTNLRYFHNDCCLGAHLKIGTRTGTLVEGQDSQQGLFDGFLQNDMSLACGMGNTSKSRFYQGWFNESESFIPIPLPKPIDWGIIELGETSYQLFSRTVWEQLGGAEDLYWALFQAIHVQTEFGEDDSVNNYRIKGQGLLTDVRLNSQ